MERHQRVLCPKQLDDQAPTRAIEHDTFHNDAHSIRTKTNAKPGRIGLPQRDLSCVICMRSSFCGAGHLPCPRVGKEWLSQSSKRLVPIQEIAGEHYLTLIKRAATLHSHGGEIAFPGGK